MLNGIDPIIIFQLYKLTVAGEKTLAKIPITSGTKTKATTAVIPIYLSELKTGLYVDTQSKNIDIDTNQNSLLDGSPGMVNQKALGSITSINLIGKRDSVGLTILLALSELILDKVTSQEYEISYLAGAVTVFGGLIHSFSFEEGSDDDLTRIKLELSRGQKKSDSISVNEDPTAERLASSGATPPPGAPTFTPAPENSGASVIQPRLR